MAVEESSLSLCLSGVQQERLFTLLSLPLCLSTARGWLFPPFQLLSIKGENFPHLFHQKRLLPGRGKAHPDAPSSRVSRAENKEMEAERGKTRMCFRIKS